MALPRADTPAKHQPDFSFAFNDKDFSEHTLCVQSPGEEGQILYISSAILAAHSDYFRTMFKNGWKEATSKSVVLKVSSREERQALNDLIEYMYTGQLTEQTDIEKVVMLFVLADRYSILCCFDKLLEIFNSFPISIKICNMVIDHHVVFHGNESLRPVLKKCLSYFFQLLKDIIANQDKFLSLNLVGAIFILSYEDLKVTSEEDVFHLMVKWVEANCHNHQTTTSTVHKLLECVRLPWGKGKFLQDGVSTHYLMEDEYCQKMIMEAIKFRSLSRAKQQEMACIEKDNCPHKLQKTVASGVVKDKYFKPRNAAILGRFWGSMKTEVIDRLDRTSQYYIEFPIEVVLMAKGYLQSTAMNTGLQDAYTVHLKVKLDLAAVLHIQLSAQNCGLAFRMKYDLELKLKCTERNASGNVIFDRNSEKILKLRIPSSCTSGTVVMILSLCYLNI